MEHLPEEIVHPHRRELQPPRELLSGNESIAAETLRIRELLANNERQQIVNLLLTFNGNITRVAKELGISRNSLYKKLNRLKISTK